jgi:hypothetical protein
MRVQNLITCCVCATLLSASGLADGLGKYQLILDKQLLGSEKVTPPPPTRTRTAPEERAPSWAEEYRMTMMTQDEDLVRVGLQHIRDQTAFLLIEGREFNPETDLFQLVSANYAQSTATIRHRETEHRFDLQTMPTVPPVRVERQQESTTPIRRRPRPTIRQTGPRNRSPSAQVEDPSEKEEPTVRRFESREELEAHLQEQQMDAIRRGNPPLPIPLTEKMDDQLVREGVLPPRGN